MSRTKWKVCELPSYLCFRNDFFFGTDGKNDAEVLDIHKQMLTRMSDADNSVLHHLEEAKDWEPPAIKGQEGLLYCIRGQKIYQSGWFRGRTSRYHCFTFQLGRWWKTKRPEEMFVEFFVPAFTYEEYRKIGVSYKHLSTRARRTCIYWAHWIESRRVRRETQAWVAKALKRS